MVRCRHDVTIFLEAKPAWTRSLTALDGWRPRKCCRSIHHARSRYDTNLCRTPAKS